jgi:hypothetical protein
MKKLLGTLFLLAAITLPALAQWQQWRLSSEDQARFDSYYSRWQGYRQSNDRDQIVSMEKRMLGIYQQYNIPAQTEFWRVASNGRAGGDQWRGRLSGEDQARFDSYFSRWQGYRQSNDRDQIVSMEKRMQGIYARYQIPSGTPYFWVASNARDDDRDEWEHDRWRGRLSRGDQARFDSYYGRWLGYRRSNDRDQIESMERRMHGVMDQYQIPPEIPFDRIASRGARN